MLITVIPKIMEFNFQKQFNDIIAIFFVNKL